MVKFQQVQQYIVSESHKEYTAYFKMNFRWPGPLNLKRAGHIFDKWVCQVLLLEKLDFQETLLQKFVEPKIKNYQSGKSLNMFSKIYERFLHENLTDYMNTFLSKFISAYSKSYSTNHVLIHLIENWKKSLDEKKIVGAVLMDLSKAFDSIPHDLLIAKMYAYGFSINAVTFFTHT